MLVRRIARPMLAAMFVVGGLSQLRRPAAKVATAAPLLDAVGSVVPLPADQATLVRANGAAMLAGGALLATGRMPRVASTLLAGSLVPTTIAGHPGTGPRPTLRGASSRRCSSSERRAARWAAPRCRRHRGQTGAHATERASWGRACNVPSGPPDVRPAT